MKIKNRLAIVVALVALTAGVRLLAHHSFAAEFDGTKAIRLTARSRRSNGRTRTPISTSTSRTTSGNVVKWGCEAGSPGALSRRGFKRGDLKLGDTVIVDGYRAKDGSRLIDARRVTLPDGRIVSGASAGDGGPGEATQVPHEGERSMRRHLLVVVAAAVVAAAFAPSSRAPSRRASSPRSTRSPPSRSRRRDSADIPI